jgi:hypothetical protein
VDIPQDTIPAFHNLKWRLHKSRMKPGGKYNILCYKRTLSSNATWVRRWEVIVPEDHANWRSANWRARAVSKDVVSHYDSAVAALPGQWECCLTIGRICAYNVFNLARLVQTAILMRLDSSSITHGRTLPQLLLKGGEFWKKCETKGVKVQGRVQSRIEIKTMKIGIHVSTRVTRDYVKNQSTGGQYSIGWTDLATWTEGGTTSKNWRGISLFDITIQYYCQHWDVKTS